MANPGRAAGGWGGRRLALFLLLAALAGAAAIFFLRGAVFGDRGADACRAQDPVHPAASPARSGRPATLTAERRAALPRGLAAVAGAHLAPLAGLAPGSAEAQERQVRAAAELGWPLEVENTIGMRFRLVPPGKFLMGSPPGAGPADGREEPRHEVAIPRACYVGLGEVTRAEWREVFSETLAPGPPVDSGGAGPVKRVLWSDARSFCRALCEKEGVPEETYRLPAEAEWEYACRAGTAGATYFVAAGAASCGEESPRPACPVANAWGLCGMADGVWEWGEDIFHGNYAGAPADGSAWLERGGMWAPLDRPPGQDRHVIRGRRDWRDAGPARSAAREAGSWCRDPDHGFRVWREVGGR